MKIHAIRTGASQDDKSDFYFCHLEIVDPNGFGIGRFITIKTRYPTSISALEKVEIEIDDLEEDETDNSDDTIDSDIGVRNGRYGVG